MRSSGSSSSGSIPQAPCECLQVPLAGDRPAVLVPRELSSGEPGRPRRDCARQCAGPARRRKARPDSACDPLLFGTAHRSRLGAAWGPRSPRRRPSELRVGQRPCAPSVQRGGGEEEHATRCAAAVAHDRGLRVRDLPFAGVAAQLRHRLVDEAVAVEPTRRELAAVGVERQHAVERDVLPAVEEVLRLALAAEPERLEPRQAVEREAVVEQRDVDVGRAAGRCGSRGAAPDPCTSGSWSSTPWSQLMRSLIWVPTASRCTGVCFMSAARSLRDTMTATAPSHGTSQSYSPNGVVIMRAFR